jgi:hypothetical protein
MTMYWSFQLGLLGRHLRDAAAIFRHQSQHLEDRYGEAVYLWSDRRGTAFAQGYLSPQLNLVPPVSTSLATMTSHVDGAKQAAEIAETRIMTVRSTAEGIEMIADAALRDAATAKQFAANAIDQARTVAAKASAVLDRVQVLGYPPI